MSAVPVLRRSRSNGIVSTNCTTPHERANHAAAVDSFHVLTVVHSPLSSCSAFTFSLSWMGFLKQVVDGAVSAQWLAAFRGLVENPLTMLL